MLSKNGIGVSHGTTIAWRHHNGALSEPIDNDWRLRASTYNRSDQGLNLRVNHQYISSPCYPLISFCLNLANTWARRRQQKRETPAHAYAIARQHDFTIVLNAMMLPPMVLPLLYIEFFERISSVGTYCAAILYRVNFAFAFYRDAFSFYWIQ